MTVEALRCPSCVAPIEVVANAMVQQCRHCGTSLRVGTTGEATDVLEFHSTEADVRSAVHQRAHGRVVELSVARILVPAMFVSGRAEGRWSAEIGANYANGSAKWTPKTGAPVKRTFRNHCVLAAEGPWSVAFSELDTRALAAVPLASRHLVGVTVLEVEGTERQREAVAEEGLRRVHEAEVRRAVPVNARQFTCAIDVQNLKYQRVLVPMWVFEGGFDSGRRRGFVDDGTLRVHVVDAGSASSSAAPAVLVSTIVALGGMTLSIVAFCGLCCGAGRPSGEKRPEGTATQMEAPVVPLPSPVQASNRVVAVRACDISGFDAGGQPIVRGRIALGDVLEVVAKDDKSVQFVHAGSSAWVPSRCVTDQGPSISSSAEVRPSLVDVPALAMRTVGEVEARLGKPSSVDAITASTEDLPGEWRTYEVKGLDDVLTVRFFRGKAVNFQIPTNHSASPSIALMKAGFDLASVPPTVTASLAQRWQQFDYKGHNFWDVAAIQGEGDWSMVLVFVTKPQDDG